jgi:zona occludens toxin (predicted ATPase)
VDHPPEATSLYAELLRLTEEMHAAAPARDDAAVSDLVERSEVIVAAIGDTPLPATAASAMLAIVRRVLTLDGEVSVLMHARRDTTRDSLDARAARRRSLQSYRSDPPSNPLFIDTFG